MARYDRINTTIEPRSLSAAGANAEITIDDRLSTDEHPLLDPASASVIFQHTPDSSSLEGSNEHATGTPFSSSINLLNTILGTGLLAMPAAVASVGLLTGIVVILLSALASGLGLYFLSRCAARTEGRSASFFAISKLTWPSLAVFFDLAIAIKCFGVAVSYLIIIGDLMPHVCAYITHDPILLDRRFWITVLMASAILPLSFLRKLDSLKYTSIVALVAVVYLCAIIVYHFFVPEDAINTTAPPQVELVTFSSVFFRRLPVFIFAFTCHQNMFSVYNELKDNSQPQVNQVIQISIGSAWAAYEAIGILGYLTFGKNVLSNIITEYPQSGFVAGGRLAIVILVVFSYPLQAHPCRASLDKILAWSSPETRNRKVPPPPSAFKYFIVTTCILVASYLIAITVTELDVVLAFVGSTGSTTISFILPGIFYYKLHQDDPWDRHKITAVCLATYGLMVMCICLTFNIVGLFR